MEWSSAPQQGVSQQHAIRYVDINKNTAAQAGKTREELGESENVQIEKSDYRERTELQTQTETDQSGQFYDILI